MSCGDDVLPVKDAWKTLCVGLREDGSVEGKTLREAGGGRCFNS